MMYNLENEVSELRDKYPRGTRVIIDYMEDSYNPIPQGTTGTVDYVDDAGDIHVNWDNGSTLAIIPETDKFHVASKDVE